MPEFAKRCRQVLAIASIIISSVAVAIPEPTYSKVLMAIGTGCNAAALYMLKEEQGAAPSVPEQP